MDIVEVLHQMYVLLYVSGMISMHALLHDLLHLCMICMYASDLYDLYA